MSYEQIKDLQPALCKRYGGVKPETFPRLVQVVADQLAQMSSKPGRPLKLALEAQVLLPLEYWRAARTFCHRARSWGIPEASRWRTIRRGADSLPKAKAGTLPGKKKLPLASSNSSPWRWLKLRANARQKQKPTTAANASAIL